jgi:hypothetical protein
VDDKLRAKIQANEFIKLSALLSAQTTTDSDQYRSVEKDGQLTFIKSTEKDSICSLPKWMEAFHIFVAIYAEKHPEAIGNLMTYISTIQQIAEACGDSAAFTYDEKFRRWRHRDPAACPWEQKKAELYQEAVLAGMDFKLKNKNQPFRGQRKFLKYCYAFNNSGICPRGRSCTFAHICQNCQGKHSKQSCTRTRQNPTTKQHNLPPPSKTPASLSK